MMSESEGGERAAVLRCWRRLPSVRYERPVHESLVGLGDAVLGRPDIVIHHDRPQHRARERKAQRLSLDVSNLRQRLSSQPGDHVTAWHLARLLPAVGEFQEARRLAEEVLRSSATKKRVFQVRVLLHLGQVGLKQEDWDYSIHRAHQALGLEWCSTEAWAILAEAAIGAGDVPRGVHALNAMMLLPQGPFELPVARRYETWWPHLQLARVALSQGRMDIASVSFNRVLDYEVPPEVRAEAVPWRGVNT